MTFGLTGEPKTFSCLGNDLCREFLDEFVIIYIDDLLIYNKTLEEYIIYVKVLRILRENKLYVKLEKCEFTI